MPTMVVPGVRVEARFDVLPPAPAPSGIVGIAGIVDRLPNPVGLVSVSRAAELRELLGPGTPASMPEAVEALANGAVEVVVAPVEGGARATVELLGVGGTRAVTLKARSPGAWANDLRVQVTDTREDGTVTRVSIVLLRGGEIVERFDDLRMAAGAADDLLEAINARSAYVVALDPDLDNVKLDDQVIAFEPTGAAKDVARDGAGAAPFKIRPADTASPTGLSVAFSVDAQGRIDVEVSQQGVKETFQDLVIDPDSDRHLPTVLNRDSRYVQLSGKALALLPQSVGAKPLAGGDSPTTTQYGAAIDRLADDPRIDLVVASVEPSRDRAAAIAIHQLLTAHAVTMADNGAPRIAFGSVTAGEAGNLDQIRGHASSSRNRRFVLVAPPGATGAVVGAIGRTSPQVSPTFKPIPLFGRAPSSYRESELNKLLGPATNVLVVQDRAGRGVVALKGIDTTGDQISVTRVADQAIRETKAIAEGYIGELNTDDARVALRQSIVATFTRMERDGALVPSTDGSDPAFLVDVYSTQQDFAQGIVRIDIAVRPVRAIDYVYATIRVKN